MSMFHRHRWQEAQRYFVPPGRDPAEGRALAALALDKAGEASDD